MTTSGSVALTKVSRRRQGRQGRHWGVAYLFIAPFFVTFAMMIIAPLCYAAWVSLFRTRIFGGTTFVGLENFARVFTDPEFYAGLLKVSQFVLIQVPLTIGLAVFVALLFDTRRVGASRGARLLMFVPNAIPAVVATLMWGYLYGSDFGPIAQVAGWFGLPAPDLLSPSAMLGSIINIAFWTAFGYFLIIMYAALQSIPEELYEAAAIDGASQWRIGWSIKLPALYPSISLCVVLALIGGFQLFTEPNLLAAIAPGSITSSYTPNLYIYNIAFSAQDISYAAAMSFVLGFIIILVSFAARSIRTRREARA